MRLGLFMSLLAVHAVVTIQQDAFGQDLRQSVAHGADATDSAQGNPTGNGERGTPAGFAGEKTSWYGFDRFDFLMNEAELTVKPFKASADEGTGVNGQVEGQLRCIVVVPKEAASGKP